uniref:Uncharacterized protein n=1 Tax=Arundo donax TaxID=35708 RepID=A0A0A9C6W9_ARUDO
MQQQTVCLKNNLILSFQHFVNFSANVIHKLFNPLFEIMSHKRKDVKNGAIRKYTCKGFNNHKFQVATIIKWKLWLQNICIYQLHDTQLLVYHNFRFHVSVHFVNMSMC